MGLLKLPRLITPERAAFERFRQRQQKRTQGFLGDNDDEDLGGKKETPLGLDPVEGEPVDLRDFFRPDGTIEPADPRDAEQADAEYEAMLREDTPEGFAEGLEKFFE